VKTSPDLLVPGTNDILFLAQNSGFPASSILQPVPEEISHPKGPIRTHIFTTINPGICPTKTWFFANKPQVPLRDGRSEPVLGVFFPEARGTHGWPPYRRNRGYSLLLCDALVNQERNG